MGSGESPSVEEPVQTGVRAVHPAQEQLRWMLRAFVEFHMEFYLQLTPLFGDDIEMVFLAEALALRAGDEAFDPAGPGSPDDPWVAGGTLAAELGLPRETARRKLVRLVEAGFALGNGRGHFRIRAGILSGPAFREAGDRIGEAAGRYVNRCFREAYLQLRQVLPGGTARMLSPDDSPGWEIRATGRADRWRLLRIQFAWYFVAIYRTRATLYEGDIEQALVSDAVGLHVGTPYYKSPAHRDAVASMKVLLGENQPGCTARWVTDVTRLPRETVRRKLKHMVKIEFLAEQPDGRYIHKPGLFLRQDIIDAILAVESHNIEFLNRCLERDIFEIVPSDGKAGEARPGTADDPAGL